MLKSSRPSRTFFIIGSTVSYAGSDYRVVDHTVTQPHFEKIVHVLSPHARILGEALTPTYTAKESLLLVGDNAYLSVQKYAFVFDPDLRTDGHYVVIDPRRHTSDCLSILAKTLLKQAAWTLAFPSHCPNCRGMGLFYDPGSRDQPPDTTPCYLCTEQGFCPRCGEYTFADNREIHPCQNCHWDWGNHPDDALPPDADTCRCYEFFDLPATPPLMRSQEEWIRVLQSSQLWINRHAK